MHEDVQGSSRSSTLIPLPSGNQTWFAGKSTIQFDDSLRWIFPSKPPFFSRISQPWQWIALSVPWICVPAAEWAPSRSQPGGYCAISDHQGQGCHGPHSLGAAAIRGPVCEMKSWKTKRWNIEIYRDLSCFDIKTWWFTSLLIQWIMDFGVAV